jgi:hypothetical protein
MVQDHGVSLSCVPSMPEPQIPASYFPRYILHTYITAELVWVLVLGKGRTFTSKILAPAGKKGVDYMSNRWKGMFLPVSKPTCSSVVFSLRLRVFFRTESYNLIGTNWYLPTCTPSCQSLNFHPDFFVKYFYCRTQCLRGHPKRWRTRVGSRSMTVGRLQFVCLWND